MFQATIEDFPHKYKTFLFKLNTLSLNSRFSPKFKNPANPFVGKNRKKDLRYSFIIFIVAYYTPHDGVCALSLCSGVEIFRVP